MACLRTGAGLLVEKNGSASLDAAVRDGSLVASIESKDCTLVPV